MLFDVLSMQALKQAISSEEFSPTSWIYAIALPLICMI